MPDDPYDDALRRARDLTPREQQKLIDELSRATNGSSGNSGKSLYEGLKEIGAIGAVKDAPPDLSTNPKYMEGFGKDGD